jgi:tripartite-type tricarboxylate transporter receptor subunit TctC
MTALRQSCRSVAMLLAVSCSALAAGPTTSTAQSFPSKPVHLVVPFAQGTAADLIARLVAEGLQSKWQQPVVVENRAGASGNIGTEYVARSAADGYTLLVSPPPPLSINRFLFRSLSFKPSDLAIVTVLASAPNVLVAKLAIPASDVAELINHAKTAKLNYASTGRGGTPHLTMEWLASAAGIQLQHVPYSKGLASALNDLLGGHVDFMFVNLSDARAYVVSGKLKALGVTSAEAISALPEVAPISRVIPGLIMQTWFALAAPGKTPAPLVMKIASDTVSVLSSPTVIERLRTMSLTVVGNSPTEASSFVEDDARRWRSVTEKIGLQPE